MHIDQLADRVSFLAVKVNANEDPKFYCNFILGIFFGVMVFCQFSILIEILMKERKDINTSNHDTVQRRQEEC